MRRVDRQAASRARKQAAQRERDLVRDREPAYEARMNALALKLATSVHGEEAIDVAVVCARMISYSISCSYETRETRAEALNRLITFMRADLGIAVN